MPTTIALFGAAGSMGTRAADAFRKTDEYHVLHVEAGKAGTDQLKQRGDDPVEPDVAAAQADVVLLAVPDKFVGAVAREVVPKMRSGSMIMSLDPAAPYAGRIPLRPEVSVFVAHPAHPPVFNDEQTMEARRDFFGSGLAKQSIVCALLQGSEEDYDRGAKIAATMWGPVLRMHRITVEQMAILEPALSETVAATCLAVIREALDEAIKRGVPPEAARDFLMGHLNVELAILFNEIDWEFSDGAKQAMEEAKKVLFQPDWRKVFDEDQLRASVERITS